VGNTNFNTIFANDGRRERRKIAFGYALRPVFENF
jgi:hypothetical protein